MIVNRNVTRVIKNSTEVTSETNSINTDPLAFNLQTTDKLYIGFKKPFTTRYFHLDTPNPSPVGITVKFWDGTQYSALEDTVDQTEGFTRSGFLSWGVPENAAWRENQQAGVNPELFWVELTVDTNMDPSTSLQAVLNLFSDDERVRAYYPYLISDARYLPEGRTNYLEQHLAAKDLVVHRLKADHLIEDESMITDINEVYIAAIHAFAYIILDPIARDEGDREIADNAFQAFNRELNRVKLDLDFTEDGKISDAEKDRGNIFISR